MFVVIVTSILLYGYETWTLLADSEQNKTKRIQAFETLYLEKLLRISYLEHKTNDWVQSKTDLFVGLLVTVKCLSKTILRGILMGGRRRGRLRKCWMDTIKDWVSLPILELPMPELLIRLPAEKTGRGSLLNRPTSPPFLR